MTHRSWAALDPRVRRSIVVVGSVEAVLKAGALIDLARRSPERVRGRKWVWAAAITLINSAGVVPIVYFRRGRR